MAEQFSSGRRRHLTADPVPYVNRVTGSRQAVPHERAQHFEYDPRAEFDRPLANLVNPVLQWARRLHGYGVSYSSLIWRTYNGGVAGTAAQFDHARRILTRLAQLHSKERS